jgi:hypothetical protein
VARSVRIVARIDNALISSVKETSPTRYTPAITQSCSAIIVLLRVPDFTLRGRRISPPVALDYGTWFGKLERFDVRNGLFYGFAQPQRFVRVMSIVRPYAAVSV